MLVDLAKGEHKQPRPPRAPTVWSDPRGSMTTGSSCTSRVPSRALHRRQDPRRTHSQRRTCTRADGGSGSASRTSNFSPHAMKFHLPARLQARADAGGSESSRRQAGRVALTILDRQLGKIDISRGRERLARGRLFRAVLGVPRHDPGQRQDRPTHECGALVVDGQRASRLAQDRRQRLSDEYGSSTPKHDFC